MAGKRPVRSSHAALAWPTSEEEEALLPPVSRRSLQHQNVSKPEKSSGLRGIDAHPGPAETYHEILATADNDDERLLARIGYRQELRREFTRWSTVSYAISILGVLGSQPATYGVPISLGGPATSVWAWFVGWLMALVIAASVSELVSAYPTAGGMYFVTKAVVPKEHVAIWGWIIGWCNFLGQACGVASIAYTIAQMIFASISMNSAGPDGSLTWSPTSWQTVILAIGFLIAFGAICSLTTKALHEIVRWFAPINVLATIGICIALPILTENTRSAAFVFTDFRDGSGWGSTVWSFFLGFLNVAWVMTDYDGTTHMSEETHDAAIRGPVAIMLAVGTSGLLGLGLNIAFTFCLTETYMNDIVGSPTGLPVAQIFLNAGGRAGGTAMLFLVILVQIFTGISAMLANARMTYAFARDGALPFSALWSKVNRKTGTPVVAVWLVVGFCGCLNLIGIGSTQTITAIFNLCAPCLDLSYIAVLIARLWYEQKNFVAGPFSLGRWSKPLNLIAITWVIFISVVLFFPPSRPVTATNMNYAIVVAGFVAVVSLAWWWTGLVKYDGPRDQINNIEITPSFEGSDIESAPPGYQAEYGTNKSAPVYSTGVSPP